MTKIHKVLITITRHRDWTTSNLVFILNKGQTLLKTWCDMAHYQTGGRHYGTEQRDQVSYIADQNYLTLRLDIIKVFINGSNS